MAQLGYRDLVTFTSTDAHGGTVYHTNVMMAIGTGALMRLREEGCAVQRRDIAGVCSTVEGHSGGAVVGWWHRAPHHVMLAVGTSARGGGADLPAAAAAAAAPIDTRTRLPTVTQMWCGVPGERGGRCCWLFTTTAPAPATVPPVDVAVVCLESVEDEAERRNLQQKLSKTHTIVDITRQQVRVWVTCILSS